MRRLTLTEYRTERGVELSPEQLAALPAKAHITVSPSSGRPGTFDLTPSSVIGGFQAGDLAVLIRPKIPIENALFLISYALSPKTWRTHAFDLDEHSDLTEAIASLFLLHLRRALRRGLLQDYREIEESSTVLRGRLRIEEQIRRCYGHLPPAEVRRDDYSEDIPQNRTLKSALLHLERLPLRSKFTRRERARLQAAFASITPLPPSTKDLPAFQYNRLNAHYRPAIELALLILRSASLDQRHGTRHARSLLLDMNVIFEEFLRTALRESLGATPFSFTTSTRSRRLHLDEDRRVLLKPDLTWWEGSRCTFVGDIKYKQLDARGARHGDLYQLHAYCTAANLSGGLLIYASGPSTPITHRTMHSGKSLAVASVDLTRSPADLLAQVSDLASEVLRLREPQT